MRNPSGTAHTSDRRFAALALVFVAVVAVVGARGAAAVERRLTLDRARSEVSFDLPATGHDVHGLIAIRGGELRFDDDTGAASGEIVLDAGSAASGNESRDRTIRDEIFEIARFPEIRFVAERMEGRLAVEGAAEIRLIGTVHVHGTRHPLTMHARVVTRGGELTAETEFPVAFREWGMKDPSLLFLRVDPVVTVKVRARGELAASPESGAVGGGV